MLVLPAIASLVLVIAVRPSILSHGSTPELDPLVFAVLGAAVVQLLPLPRPALAAVSPSALEVARAFLLVDPGGPLPISIDLEESGSAVAILGATALLFFASRQIFDRGGVRTTVRLIATGGLVLSAIAIAQDATARGLMYWRWAPIHEGPAPFGPFVNRNHFATWGVMVVPLCVGYLIAHASAHPGPSATATWRRKVVAVVDARAALLLASATILIVAIAASLSRSGLVGLGAALVFGGWLARRRTGSALTQTARPAIFVAALTIVAAAAVLTQVGPAALAGRFGKSGVALADRLAIWHDTVPVLRDFWLTGTGVGTFQTSMAIYQRSSPGVIFNQAHNHYLQVGAEGGLLVGVPVIFALVVFRRVGWRSLEADRSGMYWIRAGAAAGLAGVAVQSLWETGLTVPANAALAGVLAAIVVHVAPAPPAREGQAGVR